MQVNELINKANDIWDRRNAQAVEDGEVELPHMLPLVRLKVDEPLLPLR
jgi:double-strand break repair protein MRE11